MVNSTDDCEGGSGSIIFGTEEVRNCDVVPELAEEVGSSSSVVGIDGRGSGAVLGCGILDEGSGGVVSSLEDGRTAGVEDDGVGIRDVERVGSGGFICSIDGDGVIHRLERGSCFIVNDAEDDDFGSFVFGIELGGSGGAIFRFEDGGSGGVVPGTMDGRCGTLFREYEGKGSCLFLHEHVESGDVVHRTEAGGVVGVVSGDHDDGS